MEEISELVTQLVALDIIREAMENNKKNKNKPPRYYLKDKSIPEQHYLLYNYREGTFSPSDRLEHTREYQSIFTDDQLRRIGLSMEGIERVEAKS